MTKTVRCLMPNFAKRGGVVTVVAQDFRTHEVLMVAYANPEAYLATLRTGQAHYWKTSWGGKLWRKGESSGNTQRVVRIKVDCDGDALIYVVEQTGCACHTGNPSCFFRDVLSDVRSVEALPEGDPARLSVIMMDAEPQFLPSEGA